MRREAPSALVVSLQERWKGEQAGAAMWAITRAKDCQKRNKKKREMIKKLPQTPSCWCTCLLRGTRLSIDLNLQNVNSYKHTPHVHEHRLTHILTCTAVCPQSTGLTHMHTTSRQLKGISVKRLYWSVHLSKSGTCSTGIFDGSASRVSYCDTPFQRRVCQAMQYGKWLAGEHTNTKDVQNLSWLTANLQIGLLH